MFRNVIIVLFLFSITPLTASACGGYSDYRPSEWDLMDIESRVARLTEQEDISARRKRQAIRVLKRAQRVHTRFLKDGRLGKREGRLWNRLVARANRTLKGLESRG